MYLAVVSQTTRVATRIFIILQTFSDTRLAIDFCRLLSFKIAPESAQFELN